MYNTSAMLADLFHSVMVVSPSGGEIESMVGSVVDRLSVGPVDLLIITTATFILASVFLYVTYRLKVNKDSKKRSLRRLRRNRNQSIRYRPPISPYV
ncbi:MAG: hypothetical protein IKC93_08720 [Candidatus Methanomethylophilaceae archaeon]|nr:hypothetical protein [Candidatus Methanomethylophilaceae archaeon]